MKRNKKIFLSAVCLLVAFILWTVAISFIDVKAIGPNNSEVGFATLNKVIHDFIGTNMDLYIITDWLGLIPFAFAVVFGIIGLVQWIKRKHFLKVDHSILVLGGFYLVVILVYILFENLIINYRPVLIDGFLEISYPSSTTLLVVCVMPTTILQFNSRIKNKVVKIVVSSILTGFTSFMVIGRLISGVHWFTDIVGAGLLSGGLVMLYCFFTKIIQKC